MASRRLLIIALALIGGGLLGMTLQAGPGGWGRMHGPMMGWWDRGATSRPSPIADADTVLVEASEFAFHPDTPTVAFGEAFNLTLVNRGRLLHDLSIPALGVLVVVGAGDAVTEGVDAPGIGEYRFWCTVPGHAEAGMTGVLIVGDPDPTSRGD